MARYVATGKNSRRVYVIGAHAFVRRFLLENYPSVNPAFSEPLIILKLKRGGLGG